MVDELRAKQAEVDSRRHFTKEGRQIDDVRSLLQEWTQPVEHNLEQVVLATASNFSSAADDDFIELG